MVDTGCNTTLLPISSSHALTDLMRHFPNTHYIWRISGSDGVGALNSPVLLISPLQGTVNVELAKDLKPYNIQLHFLRFHVCYDDAKSLLDTKEVAIIKKDILSAFIKTIDAITKAVPNAKVGIRRKHALLGQQVLGQPSLVTVQHGDIFLVTDTINPLDLSIKSLSNTVAHLSALCETITKTKFAPKEFDDLEDEDHDCGEREPFLLRNELCVDE